MIEVISTGPLTLVEDLGRVGHAALGVPPSGAADRGSFRLANRLVGNRERAAGFEVTLGGFTARFDAPVTVAVTGAACDPRVDGVSVGMNGPVTVRRGATLRLHTPPRGLRSYVALRGGLDVRPVLGSRSTDVLSGLGPAPVAAGDKFLLADEAVHPVLVDLAPVPPVPRSSTLEVMPVLDGQRWFRDDDLHAMPAGDYVVGSDSNRVALRLGGRQIRSERRGEVPPSGLVPGAIQIPPNGQPVVFLADHPITGGYPVIGVLGTASQDTAAQLRPGDTLRLRFAS